VLAELHDRAPVHGWEASRVAIEAAFGRPVGELFDEIEHAPLASGSIAQARRAHTQHGLCAGQGSLPARPLRQVGRGAARLTGDSASDCGWHRAPSSVPWQALSCCAMSCAACLPVPHALTQRVPSQTRQPPNMLRSDSALVEPPARARRCTAPCCACAGGRCRWSSRCGTRAWSRAWRKTSGCSSRWPRPPRACARSRRCRCASRSRSSPTP